MPENYDHYISKNNQGILLNADLQLRSFTLIVLILVMALFFVCPLYFLRTFCPDDTSLETAFRGGKQ